MSDSQTCSDDAIRAQLHHTYDLFADIRAKFDGPGVERGGHLRAGFTPIYVKRFGAYADAILQGVKHYTVEASFSDEQLAHINEATVALRRHVVGVAPAPGLAERVVEQFCTARTATSCWPCSARPRMCCASWCAPSRS
jgi:hypothetical protein